MKTLTLFKALGPVDLKNVRRDSLLLWIPLLPVVMALALRLVVPAIQGVLLERLGFDLAPYYPLIMSGFIVAAPQLVGMIVGFLLLDERDDRMLAALLVTPVPLSDFLIYRISVPLLLGFVATFLSYPLVGLTPLGWGDLLVVALLAALVAPQVALFLATFAENKVAGFAMVKLLNTLMFFPVIAYFVPMPWQLLGGLIPVYWPAKILWLAAAGEPYLLYVPVGLAVNALAIALLLQRFKTVVHR
jgi:fluoroquinolone transport system permease protein